MKISAIFMLMVLLASSTLLAVMPAGAQGVVVPGDLDGDKIVSDEEMVAAEQSYQDGKITSEQLEEIRHIHENYPRTITDSAGREVTIYKPIKRIIVLHSKGAEIIRALESKDNIVGVSDYIASDGVYFPDLSKSPNVGKYSSLDVEGILSLSPDIILVYGTMLITPIEALEDDLKGTEILLLGLDCCSTDALCDDIEKIGYLLEKEDKAEELVSFYQSEIDTICEKIEGIYEDKKPRVYIECYGDYNARNKRSPTHLICTMAGGINIAKDIAPGKTTATSVDPEWLIEQNPDIILKCISGSRVSCGYDEDDPTEMKAVRDTIMSRLGFEKTTAVENGKIYLITPDICNGVSNVVGLAYVAKWVHPDLFEDLDPQAIHQEYLTRFQGLDYDLDEQGVFVYPEV